MGGSLRCATIVLPVKGPEFDAAQLPGRANAAGGPALGAAQATRQGSDS
jgi:hypothetical protein